MKHDLARPAGKTRGRRALALGAIAGVSALLVVMLVESLLPDSSRALRGAIVGAWVIFAISLAPLLSRRRT